MFWIKNVNYGVYMLKKINGLIIAAGLFLFVTTNIIAQTPLVFGRPVQGFLSEEDEQWFIIRHTANSFVVVETSGSTDTYLEAYDSSDNLLAKNDDYGDDINARLEIYIAAGSNYLIKLRCYDEDESGPYSIVATLKPIPRPTELSFGNPINANLAAKTEQWYSVTSPNAGIVMIDATSDTIDAYLEVFDSSYKLISADDDSGGNTDARIMLFAEAGKTYLVKLKAFDSGEYGRYKIGISFSAAPADTERNTDRSRAAILRPGVVANVYLRTISESRWYRYDVSRPNTLITVYTKGSIDTTLAIYDSSGNMITEDDDSGEELNASISERVNSGTVYIKVGTFSNQTGFCTLNLEVQ
jgi:hypothetical protein